MRNLPLIMTLLSCVALSACNGTALVTLTATQAPATTAPAVSFLTYRVTVTSIALQQANGGDAQNVLSSPVSVDLAQATNFSEIVSAATVKKGTYASATVTLDYSHAIIVADNDTLAGVTLTPQNAAGAALGQVTLVLNFDPANQLSISKGSTSQFALDFRLAASNLVNVTAGAATGTVTVTPVMIASASPIDSKLLRLRGPLSSADTTNSDYTAGIEPFDGLVSGAGSVQVIPTTSTIYEVNGIPTIGAAGFTALAGLSGNAWTVAYGTLTSTTNSAALSTTPVTSTGGTTTDGTTTTASPVDAFGGAATTTTDTSLTSTATTTDITFAPTQIYAGSSVQGGADRITGIVTARSGNTLTVPTATLISAAGVESFVSGVATITLGTATTVTLAGQAAAGGNSTAQISIGSTIDAFGTASVSGGGNVALNASAGLVRLENTTAAGAVTTPGTGSLYANLYNLDGRNAGTFDFVLANPGQYLVDTGALDLTNAVQNASVILTGLTADFGSTSPDFTASALLDPTTINAELVLDFGAAGSAVPFAAISSSELDMLISVAGAGSRHQVAVGGQVLDVTQMTAGLIVVPSSTSTLVYAIAHTSSSMVENFNSFANFITALQGELTGSTLATTITAEGIYATAGNTLTATSVTVALKD